LATQGAQKRLNRAEKAVDQAEDAVLKAEQQLESASALWGLVCVLYDDGSIPSNENGSILANSFISTSELIEVQPPALTIYLTATRNASTTHMSR
jgi:hypothetical protein